MSLGLSLAVGSFISRPSDWHLSSAQSGTSQVHIVLLLFAYFRNNAWVWSDRSRLWGESICRSRYKLTLVVGASITNDDLGRVLVGHHDGRLWQTTSVGIWMVSLKRLFDHSCVQISSLLKHFSCNRIGFWRFFGVTFFDVALCRLLEAHRNCLSILHKYTTAGCYSCILEIHVWFVQFFVVESLSSNRIVTESLLTFTRRSMIGNETALALFSAMLWHGFWIEIIHSLLHCKCFFNHVCNWFDICW